MYKKIFNSICFASSLFLSSYSIASTDNYPIEIGAIYNLTGQQAILDTFSANGAQLAVDQINAAGGVLGRQLKLDLVDGKTNISTIHLAAKKFAQNADMPAVIGLSDTNMVLAAAPIIANAHKVFITSGATSPLLPQQVPDYLFLACYGDNAQGDAAADYVYKALNDKSAYIIYDGNMEYTRLLANYFQRHFTEIGGIIIGQDNYSHTQPEIKSAIAQIKAQNPDAIFLAAGPGEAAPLIKELRAEGFTQPIIGGDSFDSKDLLHNLDKKNNNNIFYTTHAFLDNSNKDPDIQKFIKAYQEKFHQFPTTSFAALGYDTVELLTAAVRKSHSTDPEKIRQALKSMKNWDGVTGNITFKGNDDIPYKTVSIIKVINGVPELASTWTPKI